MTRLTANAMLIGLVLGLIVSPLVSAQTAAKAGDKVNINTASLEELQKLPRIGPLLFPSRSSNGITLGVSCRSHRWTVHLGFEYLAVRNKKDELDFVPVYPPSSGTSWEFLLLGKFRGRTFVSSLSVGYGF